MPSRKAGQTYSSGGQCDKIFLMVISAPIASGLAA